MKLLYCNISHFTILFSCLIFFSCSGSDLGSFQKNNPDPPYDLLHIFDDYPAINEAIYNLDSVPANEKLGDFIQNGTDLDLFCINISSILSDQSISFTAEIAKILSMIIEKDICYYNNPSDLGFYANSDIEHEKNFYRAIDVIMDNSDIGHDVLEILEQVLKYNREKDPGDIEQSIEDFIEDIADPDFKNDFIDFSTQLSKFLIANDYPIWLDTEGNVITSRKSIEPDNHTNTDMGNLVKGTIKVFTGLYGLASNDPTLREIIYDIIREDVKSLIKPDVITQVTKKTVYNLAYYFSADGDGYNTSDYYCDSSGMYVNAELKETIREMFPSLVKLFIRADDTASSIPDYSIAYDAAGQSPLEAFTCSLDKLKQAGIDYSQTELEPSLLRMIDYNAWGKRRTDYGTTKLSYFDHFLYSISTAYKFGFLSRKSSDGEPSVNSDHGHGISTNGILTINDVIYALDMPSNALCPGLNLYDMALDDRIGQAENISRSSKIFSHSAMAQHKFYMGADYPIALLVPSLCAGDAGIPNGGETSIIPTSNTTTVSTRDNISNNDFRTYFPKVADGLGAVNTAEFLLSLIPRACWDGEGPFYHAPDSTGTTSFNWPGKGLRTVKIYYKPNKEIYAYVYKPSSNAETWEYYYPVSGNDISDDTGQRSNRYRDKIESDYYLVKYKQLGTTYYAAPPVNPDGSCLVKSGNKFILKGQTSCNASNFILEEKIKQNNPIRECKSQEEAIFRNYQWLCFDKKLTFIIPLYINMSSVIQIAGFMFTEGNGFLGLVNSRKGPKNAYWLSNESDFPIAKYSNSNIGIGNIPTGNIPDYMESHIPGDGRLTLLLTQENPYGGIFTPELMFDNLIGEGFAFPGAIACSIPTVLRLAFLQEEMVEADSSDIGNLSSQTWNNRNRLLPIIVALTGTLRDMSQYNAPASGNNYNYSKKHKLPISELLEGIIFPLTKPHLRYMEDLEHSPEDSAYWGNRWVQRVEDESLGVFSYMTPNIVDETSADYFLPNNNLRSILSVLSGNNVSGSDGVIPLITNETNLLSRIISILQKCGNSRMTSARKNLFLGLEQCMTSIKTSKSEIAEKNLSLIDSTPYTWIFTPREEDLLLDDILEYEGPIFSDDPKWEDFDSSIETLNEFLNDEKDISASIINIMEAVLGNQLSESEIEGVMYTTGKLFGRYTGNEWQFQGENSDYDAMYKLITFLPAIHEILRDSNGKNYINLIDNLLVLLENDSSILHYAVNSMNTGYSSEQIFKDLHDFSNCEIAYGENALLWGDMSDLLYDLSDIVKNPPTSEDLSALYKRYGFQRN